MRQTGRENEVRLADANCAPTFPVHNAFPDVAFGDRLTLEYLPQSDHTFAREADRAWLICNLLNWLGKSGFANLHFNQ